MKKHDVVLWILFAVFVFMRIAVSVSYWQVLSVIACILAVVLLIKCHMPSAKYIVISIVLALAATLAYLGYQRDPGVLLYGLTAGIPTLLTSFAVFSVMEKNGGFELISSKGKRPVWISLGIALGSGIILSVINQLLSGNSSEASFSLWKLLLALNPGIHEEMTYRAIFMAYCVYFAKETKMNAFSIFTMYFMMIVPHTISHGMDFVPTAILCVLFGLPFALLQRKRDIFSAMISHWLVDAVRFTLSGM